MRIKKGDTVLVISGKDRGKRGKVLEVFPKEGRVLVENVNLVKKHRRAKSEREKGQVIEIVKSINASNAKLICSKCAQATRVGRRLVGKKKYRVCKKCGQEI